MGAAVVVWRFEAWSFCVVGVLLLLQYSSSPTCCAADYHFQYSSVSATDDSQNFLLQPLAGAKGPSADANGAMWLTPDPRQFTQNQISSNTVGRLVYRNPLQFKASDDAQEVVSFNTSFSFQIITPCLNCGDGLAFFIAPSYEVPSNTSQPADIDLAMFLGIANGTNSSQPERHLFAIEFDTHQDPEVDDISYSHIGIDINGLVSLPDTNAVIDTSGISDLLNLYGNYTFTAWVEYNSPNRSISVWVTNQDYDVNPERPSSPTVTASYDLSAVFKQDMYIGISASCYHSYEGHALFSWNFSMETITTNPPQLAPSAGPPQLAPSDAQPPGASSHLLTTDAHRKKKLTGVELAGALSSVATLVVVTLAACAALVLKKRSGPGIIPGAAGADIQLQPFDCLVRRYTYNELRRTTHDFSEKNKIGEGGSGVVYKGTLPDGSVVAVKRLKDGLKKEAEFASEINIISGIRHRNLLQLKGWCHDKGHALLVYDYMPNGSLDNFLHAKRRRSSIILDSETRFNILKGVAAALEYLHGGLGGCVVHRDVKAANVLLTERLDALVGDFGLARLVAHNQAVTVTAAGSPGYVAPEVVYTGKVTAKADVYSFGILALEMAAGRPTLDVALGSQKIVLLEWVWLLQQSSRLMDALDPSILEEAAGADEARHDILAKWRCVLHLGLLCCQPSLESRPSMRKVYQVLQDGTLLPLPFSKPIFPTGISPLSSATTLGLSSTPLGLSSTTGSL